MTVSYNLDVSSTSFFGFLKLQFRWRGSIWKSVLLELLLFSSVFAVITYVYRADNILTEEQRRYWDDFSALFDQKLDYIPLTFMLGFFVTIIVGRWNEIFSHMGWVDYVALPLSTYLRGSDEKSRMIRRNIVRYMVLTQVLLLRDISMQVRRRFPTLETVVAAGFMSELELEKWNDCPQKFSKIFLPIQWCFTLLFEARQSGKIGGDLLLNEIVEQLLDFRRAMAKLSNYDWVPIPLVYPQVVFLAVRAYFVICLVARQSILIDGEKPTIDTPWFHFISFIMTALQFIFYVGWMKVAESLMNPLGEDDDDFELNFLVDRNLAVGLSIVDDNYNEVPLQRKDVFWCSAAVEPLYSADTALKPVNPQVGSAAQYEPEEDEVTMMRHVNTDENEGFMDDSEAARLLPRVVSVVSVNRNCGSRTSLASRSKSKTGFISTIKKQFSKDHRKHARGNRTPLNTPLNSSFSLNLDGKPTMEMIGGSSCDILGDLVEDAIRTNGLLTPDGDVSPASATRRASPQVAGPLADLLMSVPEEEDEEHQRTRTKEDLQRWKEEHDEKIREFLEEHRKQ